MFCSWASETMRTRRWSASIDVTRPQMNIVYNDNGPAAPPGIVEKTKFTDIFISGWSVGMQIQY